LTADALAEQQQGIWPAAAKNTGSSRWGNRGGEERGMKLIFIFFSLVSLINDEAHFQLIRAE